jgi:hypothetical protein
MVFFNVFILVSPLFSTDCFSRWITSHTKSKRSAKSGKSNGFAQVSDNPADREAGRKRERVQRAPGLNLEVNPLTKR